VSPNRRRRSDLFTPPQFEDDDVRRSSSVLLAVFMVQAILIGCYGILLSQLTEDSGGQLVGIGAFAALQVLAAILVRGGALAAAGVVGIAAQILSCVFGASAPLSAAECPGLFLAILIGGQVFGARGALLAGVAAVVSVVVVVHTGGGLGPPMPPWMVAVGLGIQLISATVFMALSSRTSLAVLQRLRREQQEQQRLNTDLSRRVRDEETLVAIGQALVEGEGVDDALKPTMALIAEAWSQPVVLMGRGDGRPEAISMSGFRSATLVGGDDEAARIVAEDGAVNVTIVDGARTYPSRAVGVRTGTVPHGILVAATADDGPRPPSEADGLLKGAAALLAAAFEWREATGRLRASERRRAALVKSSPDAFLIVEEGGTVVDANPAAMRLLGDEEYAVVGRLLSSLEAIAPDDLKRISEALTASRQGRSTPQMALTLQLANNRVAHVELRVIYSVDDGRGRFDIAMRDTTARFEADRQRERLEAQLFAARRLEALGQLAGGVAHDFNNLLSVILTNARLLSERKEIDDTAREDLQEIVECGRRAADLTSQLLTFARQQRREPKILDVNRAVRGVEKLLRRLMPTSITIVFTLEPDPWPVVVDPAQLEQVLVNLVANARDAMEGGGTCTVTTANVVGAPGVPVDSFGPARFLELTVQDTGMGMDEETKAHVFEPFFTTKPMGRGSGLGLATVYGIVKQSGGHIVVDSSPGQGAAFRVFLPYAALAEDMEHTPAIGDALSLGRERVLVVDDDDAVRRATERSLVSRGFFVLLARSPAEAIALSSQAFDAVVVDLVMPGMGGDTLVAQLRDVRPDLPAVLLTGYGRKSVELARPFRLLRKPASPDELGRSLRGVIDEAAMVSTEKQR
jgi:PAS domain S-box-containing protein